MDDGRLRAILTAVERGSFSKAASELGYTQSAMTHLVNNIESELGCTLLKRGSHGVSLSEEGQRLLPYIKNVLSACDALRQEAASLGEDHRSQLSIGCFASIARSYLPKILQEFGEQYPEINIDVLVAGYELPTLLEKGEVQLALVDEKRARGFDWTPILSAPLVAVVPLGFKWASDTISLERLLKEPFLTCQEQYVESLLPEDTKCISVTATDDSAILSMVAAGLGVSVISALSLSGFEDKVRAIRLDKPLVVPMGAAVKSLPAASSAVRKFIKFLAGKFPAEGGTGNVF